MRDTNVLFKFQIIYNLCLFLPEKFAVILNAWRSYYCARISGQITEYSLSVIYRRPRWRIDFFLLQIASIVHLTYDCQRFLNSEHKVEDIEEGLE